MDTNLVTQGWLIANPDSTAKIGDPIPSDDDITPVMVDYVVLKGPVDSEGGEVFQTGNAIQFANGSKIANELVIEGSIVLKSLYTPPALNTPGTPTVAETQIKKQYRNSDILNEYPRTVNGHTHHHIRTVEGHEFDLTNDEYAGEVRIKE